MFNKLNMKSESHLIFKRMNSLSPKSKLLQENHSQIDGNIKDNLEIGQFHLLRTIGTGCFSRVRLAIHTPTSQIVVLKMIKKSMLDKQKQVDRVKSEKIILQRLRCPFVVRLLGTFQDPKYLYMIQEYIQGGELYKALKLSGRFTIERVRFYSAEITSTLIHLHTRCILYRDLKPENVLITNTGHIKFVDFGFAKHIKDGDISFTLCGTPEYLAPEMVSQSGHDFALDWWTLGILLFEMATGRPPFIDQNPIELYRKILYEPVVFPENFDAHGRDLISKLLEKDSMRRISGKEVKKHAFFQGIN